MRPSLLLLLPLLLIMFSLNECHQNSELHCTFELAICSHILLSANKHMYEFMCDCVPFSSDAWAQFSRFINVCLSDISIALLVFDNNAETKMREKERRPWLAKRQETEWVTVHKNGLLAVIIYMAFTILSLYCYCYCCYCKIVSDKLPLPAWLR